MITADERLMRKWKIEEEMLTKPARQLGETELEG